MNIGSFEPYEKQLKLGNRHLIVGAGGLQSGVGPEEIAPTTHTHPPNIPKTESWLRQLLQQGCFKDNVIFEKVLSAALLV